MAYFEEACENCGEYVGINIDSHDIFIELDSSEEKELLKLFGSFVTDPDIETYGVVSDEFKSAIKNIINNRYLLSTEEEEFILNLGKKLR